MAGIFDNRFNTTIVPPLAEGVMQGRFDPEVKVEEQPGSPTKTTTIMRPRSPEPQPEVQPDLQAEGEKFNPMASWLQAGEILDTTHPHLTQGPSEAQQGPPGTPPVQPPNPFDQMNLQGPQGDVSGAAFNSPHLGGGPIEQPAGQGFYPMEYPGVPVPQGAPPGQPMPDPTAGYAGPNADMSQPAISQPPFGAAGGMEEVMSPQDEGFSSGASMVEQDWTATLEQAEVPPAQQAQQNAVIATSAQQNDGTSTVGGAPAADDPAMQRVWGDLAYNPTKRKNEYTKRMNTIFMQTMLLDVAAKAMGVESRAGAFMDHQMAVLESEMKFDDQERLYRITQGVFYPNGVYNPPQTQREAFERAMALGATAEEAAGISGYMPDDPDFGFDTYYRAQPDGSVQTIYVPKGQAPPENSTDASGIATHNADVNNPKSGTVPTALQVEAQVDAWNKEANALEQAGDTKGAMALRARADNLLALGGGASTKNEYSYAQANSTFNSVYGGKMRASGAMGPDKDNTMRDTNGNYIPWGVYRQQWLDSWDVPVMGRDGIVRKEPGWLQISSQGKVETLPTEQRIASESDIMRLREVYAEGGQAAEDIISYFVETFGENQLPEEFR